MAPIACNPAISPNWRLSKTRIGRVVPKSAR
jgi:hypothetical protein